VNNVATGSSINSSNVVDNLTVVSRDTDLAFVLISLTVVQLRRRLLQNYLNKQMIK